MRSSISYILTIVKIIGNTMFKRILIYIEQNNTEKDELKQQKQ